MMFCHICGAQISDGASFCEKCGTKLIQEDNPGQARTAPSAQNVTASAVRKKKPAVKLLISVPLILILIGVPVLLFCLPGSESGGRKSRSSDTHDDEYSADDYDRNRGESVALTQTYLNEDEGFSFMYPDGWQIEDIEEDSNDPYPSIVSVVRTGALGWYARIAVDKEIDDGSFFTASRVDFEEDFFSDEDMINGEIIDLSDIVLDGHPARKLTWAFDNDIGTRIVVIQYFYIRDSYVYFVTCEAADINYDRYEPIFEAIIDSYNIYAANTTGNSAFPSGWGYSDDSNDGWAGDDEDPFGYEWDEDYEDPFGYEWDEEYEDTPDSDYDFAWVEMPYTATDEFGIRYISGVLENTSGFTKEYVTVHFNLYDANGYLIGTTSDTIQSLKNGEKWKFSAMIYQSGVAYWDFSDISAY